MMELEARLSGAIAAQGNRLDETPSAEILALLAEMAREERLADLSSAYLRFVEAHPLSRHHVRARIPAKFVNQYLYLHLDLPHKAIEQWKSGHPGWADHLCDWLEEPGQLERGAATIVRRIRALDAGHG